MDETAQYSQHRCRFKKTSDIHHLAGLNWYQQINTQFVNLGSNSKKANTDMLNLNIFLSAILKCLYSHITVGVRKDIPQTLALNDSIKCKHIYITNVLLSQIL